MWVSFCIFVNFLSHFHHFLSNFTFLSAKSSRCGCSGWLIYDIYYIFFLAFGQQVGFVWAHNICKPFSSYITIFLGFFFIIFSLNKNLHSIYLFPSRFTHIFSTITKRSGEYISFCEFSLFNLSNLVVGV